MSKKRKKVKSKNIEKEIDLKFNYCMKEAYKFLLTYFIVQLYSLPNKDEISEAINAIEDVYYKIDKREVEGMINEYYFMEILNYISDFLTVANISISKKDTEKLNKAFDFYAEKISNILKDNDLGYELYIFSNKTCLLLCNPKLYNEEQKKHLITIKALTDVIFAYIQYVSIRVLKIKNNEIIEFAEKNEKIVIKYGKNRAFSNNLVMSIYESLATCTEKSVCKNELVIKTCKSLDKIYSDFLSRNIDKEFHSELSGYLYFTKKYNIPIVTTSKVVKDDLLKLPNDRKYSYSSVGIRFVFLDENSSVEYIDMIEKKDVINFNVFLKNEGGLFMSDYGDTELSDKSKEIIAPKFRLPFLVYKKYLAEANDVKDLIDNVSSIGYSIGNDDISINQSIAIRLLVLNCLYCAYYDYNMFNNSIRISERNIYSKKGDSSRKSGFRVGYIRKLPLGSNMSDMAKENARKEGFTSIPEGYTFVKSTYIGNDDKKIIKIK